MVPILNPVPSEAEIQRFCQSFMTELQKYVGPGLDLPSMGVNCGSDRDRRRTVNTRCYVSLKTWLWHAWGGSVPHPEVHGYGPVSLPKSSLEARGAAAVSVV